MKQADLSSYLVHPNPDNGALTSQVTGRDHTGADVDVDVVTERGLTVYLNKQEIKALLIYIPLKQRNYIYNYIYIFTSQFLIKVTIIN